MIQAFIRLLYFIRTANLDPSTVRVTIEFANPLDAYRAKHVLNKEVSNLFMAEDIPQPRVSKLCGIEFTLTARV